MTVALGDAVLGNAAFGDMGLADALIPFKEEDERSLAD